MRTVGDARAVLIGAVLLIALEACGSSAQPTANAVGASASTLASEAAASPTAAPTPSPTLSQDQIRSAAAKAYLAAVNKANATSRALNKKYATFASLAQARAYYKAVAALEATHLKALRAITYPTDTAGDAHSLIVKESALQALCIEGSAVKTVADLDSVQKAFTSTDRAVVAASDLVRGDLGLPPVPKS
jgi:hypothetical protein